MCVPLPLVGPWCQLQNKFMKNQLPHQASISSKLAVFALVNTLLVVSALGALPTISVNFEGCCGDNGAGGEIGATPLVPTDVAGLIPLPNWNSINGNNVHGTALKDSNGVPTTVTIHFDADESWSSETGTGTGDD